MTSEGQQAALVTGAAKGIGRAVALVLAGQGLFVHVHFATDEAGALETLEMIKKNGGQGCIRGFDVRDASAVEAGVKEIVAMPQKLSVLVNNAGIKNDRLLAMMKKEAWQQVMDTNLNGFYHVTKPVVKQMLKNRYGRIVNMVSVSGQTGNSGQVNYAASKAGLIGATKALAREVAGRNITVNAVSPGFIDTGMLKGMDLEQVASTIPAGRLGTPEDVAWAVRFLCSEEASYITGQVLGVNGGML